MQYLLLHLLRHNPYCKCCFTIHCFTICLFAETASVQLTIDLDSGSQVSPTAAQSAIVFGLDLDPNDRRNVNKFIVAFLTKLLYQREKIELGLLDSQLSTAVRSGWEDVLSFLETGKRKLMRLHSGSVTFTLFCPTQDSYDQLHEPSWRKLLRVKLLDFLKQIGKYFFKIIYQIKKPLFLCSKL